VCQIFAQSLIELALTPRPAISAVALVMCELFQRRRPVGRSVLPRPSEAMASSIRAHAIDNKPATDHLRVSLLIQVKTSEGLDDDVALLPLRKSSVLMAQFLPCRTPVK